jgi:hypothetical protein
VSNVYRYDVVFEDYSTVAVDGANFSITKTDVTFYGEDDEIVFWLPVDSKIKYIRRTPDENLA